MLTLEGTRSSEVTAFIVRTTDVPEPEVPALRYPEQAADPEMVRSVFERFGLPTRLEA